jgi:hypothetical protein
MTMKRLFLPLLIGLVPTPGAARDYTAGERQELRCVAAFALVAYDQQRGAPGWDGLPDLTVRGAHFSDVVRARLAKGRGHDDEAIKAAVRNQISQLQAEAIAAENPQAITHDVVHDCLALADRIDPPPAEPTMLRCAALSAVAYQDLQARDGQSEATTAMAMLAAVLESEARKELRAASKSGPESDAALGLEREAIAATRPDDSARVNRNGEELRLCMGMVKPPSGDSPH